ncbi:unnamed protein product [Staurois parvus]|uniref:Uncharacterized protein n=1 Tax=Staurois parvus TaxID=386267 RepID=A0ABN9CGV2_9NEOB|nr:unnamed protein product [Staurois parvus]
MPLVPFFIGFFEFWQAHGPHDPLLPGGPMSCQSAPEWEDIQKHFNFCPASRFCLKQSKV